MMPFIDLRSQYDAIRDDVQVRIQNVLENGQYIMGPEVRQLEDQLAKFVGVESCISCANGTDALQLALLALDIGHGDAVFTTPYTFFATAEAISLVGARPVFVDVNKATFNIEPTRLEEAIDQVKQDGQLEPKAVIAVDLFGLPADYEALEPICRQNGLKLIEDAAQGLGGEINGRMAGAFGDVATTSFFPAKPLGCYGDGGAIFTSDQALAEKIQSLRVHGKGIDKYDNVRVGMNSRLDTLQAAILLAKLRVFEAEIANRQRIASWYSSGLSEFVEAPMVPEGFKSVWAQYTIKCKMRHELVEKLRGHGVPTAIYYPKPLHLMGAYSHFDYRPGDFPISEKLSQEVISLPMHPYMDEELVQEVIHACRQSLGHLA